MCSTTTMRIEAEQRVSFLPVAVPSCVETRTDMDSPGSRAAEGTAHTSKPPSPSPTLYATISNEIMATSSVKKKRICYMLSCDIISPNPQIPLSYSI